MGFDFRHMSVLVVEDTLPMQRLVSNVLDTLGVGKIFCADNGEVGYKICCRENPDIILTDWHMPVMDGVELVSKIRSDGGVPNKMVPIIMMTGYSAFSRISEARDSGVTEFLVKPFSAADLARRIAYVINKPRDFVMVPDYKGPDRRRRKDASYDGPLKRADDGGNGGSDKVFI